MKNFDLENNQTFKDAQKRLTKALTEGDKEARKDAIQDIMTAIAVETKEEAKKEVQNGIRQANNQFNDEQVLMNRGTNKPLTSKERKYFNEVIEKKTFDPDVVDELFPTTLVTDVISQIEQEHPILSRIDMVNTAGLVKYIFSKPGSKLAFWGEIRSDIRQLILDGFEIANLQSYKLSGFVVILKGMLELGPDWLATYVTRSLREIMSHTLEVAIVAGKGPGAMDGAEKAPQPVGMVKSLTGVVDGVHPDKTPVVLNDLTPKSMAGLRAAIAKAKTDNGTVSVLVNPTTYWTKLFPNLSVQVDGKWTLSNLPTGEEIIPSHAVPEERMIYGNLKNYFLAVSGDVRINKYTETLAIEDLDLYIAKFFGNGIPKDANAFFVADISGIQGATVAPLDEDPSSETTADSTTTTPKEA